MSADADAKLDAAKERGKARKLYNAIIVRFPNDDLAIEAAKRLTAIADVEGNRDGGPARR